MFYDFEAVNRERKSILKYIELKEFISSKDDNGKLNEWFLAYEHLVAKEDRLKELEEENSNYRQFFLMLRNFLPKSFSSSDIIG